jgi:hypothetical protein
MRLTASNAMGEIAVAFLPRRALAAMSANSKNCRRAWAQQSAAVIGPTGARCRQNGEFEGLSRNRRSLPQGHHEGSHVGIGHSCVMPAGKLLALGQNLVEMPPPSRWVLTVTEPLRLCGIQHLSPACCSTETPMRRMPELSALDSAKSMMRDVPPKCTAGFARQSVSSSKRLPLPPANTYAMAERANGALGAGLVKDPTRSQFPNRRAGSAWKVALSGGSF